MLVAICPGLPRSAQICQAAKLPLYSVPKRLPLRTAELRHYCVRCPPQDGGTKLLKILNMSLGSQNLIFDLRLKRISFQRFFEHFFEHIPCLDMSQYFLSFEVKQQTPQAKHLHLSHGCSQLFHFGAKPWWPLGHDAGGYQAKNDPMSWPKRIFGASIHPLLLWNRKPETVVMWLCSKLGNTPAMSHVLRNYKCISQVCISSRKSCFTEIQRVQMG